MNFGSDHYVPIMKVKRGEKAALALVSAASQARITPLLEIVERKIAPTVAAHLDTAFKGLEAGVRPYARCFLDTHEIQSDGPRAAAEVFRRATAEGIVFAPVTGLSRKSDVAAALEHRKNGIALRVTRQEFEQGGLSAAIERFLQLNRLVPESVDLIVDLGAVDSMIAEGIVAFAHAFLGQIPDHVRWRTFTVSACAFPLSMRGVGRNSYALVDRAEWIAWRDGLHANRRNLQRLPTFSDCAIQHPKGVEDFDPRTMQVSAAARYTLDHEWLLIKGVSTRQVPPGIQFPRIASRLVNGLRTHFRGAAHCIGCSSMNRAAAGAPKLGSAEAWRRLGTIHHLTTVSEAVSALP